MITDAIFLLFVAITLLGAVLAVSLQNIFYNALSLILSLFGVAGLFIYLNSEFMAVMQIIIYIGAISIAIIFAIMLTHPAQLTHELRNKNKVIGALLIGVSFFALLAVILCRAQWAVAPLSGDYSIAAIGKEFLTSALVPFEAVSLVLLVAIIGALVISSKETN